ncbi:flagellar assembly peptidoglycan hydrolase FlgJ [Aestuariibacter sp. AA17]|uniref:Peptidoglycan hydrolase FlgJ n=1 Tax=Fluctibacter corallii TaxID=2984329 RepID=A0ABT3A9W6_9ALTE|nr:flagellar assembly peptidoglycan hydrolase FlgJ [Aestuariibacter sp. AA17]MCV2885480.1 flagellar assembly peptidoglycan hydrolase FlgJ [Aestuariibacter sp. AA17]
MDFSSNMQNQLEMSRNVHDFKGIDNLRRAAQEGDESALKEAAQQFEAIFVQMMLKSMRQAQDALSDKDSPFNSQQVKFYRDMHDQQLAVDLASSGSMGLADLIIQQLSPNKEGFTPASIIRQDGNLSSLLSENRVNRRDKPASPLALSDVDNASNSQPAKRQVFDTPESFIDALVPVVEQEAAKLGLDPHALVAQAAVETGWGKHMIHGTNGQNSHNLFGIKANQGWQGERAHVDTLEYRDGVAKKEKAHFRAYDSFADSVKDYVSFVSENPRYKQAIRQVEQPQQYFSELQKAGYATDPNYADKVISVLNHVKNHIGSALTGR